MGGDTRNKTGEECEKGAGARFLEKAGVKLKD